MKEETKRRYKKKKKFKSNQISVGGTEFVGESKKKETRGSGPMQKKTGSGVHTVETRE